MGKYMITENQGEWPEIWTGAFEEFLEEEKLPHKKNFIKSMEAIQYCKVEIFRNCIMGTMKVPTKNRDLQEHLDFGFFLTEDKIYFVGEEELLKKEMGKVIENLPQKAAAEHVLLCLLETLLEEDVLFLLKLEEELEAMEERLLMEIPEQFYETLVRYRKEIYRFHAYYEQLMDIGDSMQDYTGTTAQSEDAPVWEHFTGRAERLHNHTEMLREYLVQIRELYQTRIDMQQNKVMSFLTVVTTIFLPLTLIAGWYGMNFTKMPELGWRYGYLAVIIVSLLVMICEIIYFKRKRKSWNPE